MSHPALDAIYDSQPPTQSALDSLYSETPPPQPAPKKAATLGEKISGTFGSLFPIGSAGERAQAIIRMGGSRLPFLNQRTGGPQSYEQALADIQAAKRQAPTAARVGAGILGQGVQAAALPGGPVAQNLLMGAVEGGLGSAPKSVAEHATDAAFTSLLSGLLGKTFETASTGLRSLAAAGRAGRGAANQLADPAVQAGQALARRELAGSSPIPIGLEHQANVEAARAMSPDAARLARSGFLSEAGRGIAESAVPGGVEGAALVALATYLHHPAEAVALAARRAAGSANRVGPVLRALDQAVSGGKMSVQDLARTLGLSLTNPVSQTVRETVGPVIGAMVGRPELGQPPPPSP